VVGVGRTVATQCAEPGKDVLSHHLIHLCRGEVLEARPAEVLVGSLLRILSKGKDRVLYRFLEPGGLVLLQGMEIVEAPQEQEIGDLLDYLERVGNAPGPEGIPDAVDLIPDLAGEHGLR
jgi:hypothetical protein